MNKQADKNVKNPLVYIVILNYNGIEDTLQCIASLQKLVYPRYQVLIIDNGSAVSGAAEVRKRFTDVEVIESAVNLGFAGGCNLGMKVALERNADYVWLLNNDTEVAEDALSALVETLEHKPEYGIVGSKIMNYGTDTIDSAGGRIFPFLLLHGWTENIGGGETDRGQYDRQYKIDYAPGCSMLVRAELIRIIGMMDEAYFLYFEETDWCVRAGRAGWQIGYVHNSVVYHKGSQSVRERSPLQYYYCARNSLLFIAKNYRYWLFTALYWWPRYFWLNHWMHRRTVHLQYCWRALGDFRRKKYGAMSLTKG